MGQPYELRKTSVAVEEILTEQGRSAVVICVMATRWRMNARLGGLKATEIKGDGLR
jgi:hypothetical protein